MLASPEATNARLQRPLSYTGADRNAPWFFNALGWLDVAKGQRSRIAVVVALAFMLLTGGYLGLEYMGRLEQERQRISNAQKKALAAVLANRKQSPELVTKRAEAEIQRLLKDWEMRRSAVDRTSEAERQFLKAMHRSDAEGSLASDAATIQKLEEFIGLFPKSDLVRVATLQIARLRLRQATTDEDRTAAVAALERELEKTDRDTF
jgi:hypothetical protein